VDRASTQLAHKGYTVRNQNVVDDWNVEEELKLHQWADVILLQTPVNWMGVPWRFKQYMDEVYSAGMGGQLCNGDGRSRSNPASQYGAGGTLTGKKYMLSLTFNAPREAFDDDAQYLFQGRDVDDLFFPMHMNFRFFGMQPLATFACYDVLKDPQIDDDFRRFDAHIDEHF
ncbi:MAG: NAD(P)H-dependent oxidoreductase, partial [Pseudomonadota bacterium]